MKTDNFTVCVTDTPYCAAGDGKTNDRAAIQAAVDDAYKNGGGTVELTAGRVFLSGGIILRSNVTLLFGEGAVLLQSPDPGDYVKPQGEELVPYRPGYGFNFSEEIKWSHCWYKNYPFIFAPEGSSGFAVKGRGTVRMMEVDDPGKIIRICPVGFYRCSDFEISGIHITNYHSYAVMPFTCERGVFANLKIDGSCHGNGDGICLMNCRDIRVTGCEMDCGDDAVYIFSSYRDPRKSEWWNSDEPQASESIEIDRNSLRTNHCKAFGMILWGIECPDREKIEVRNVFVHDNYFETMGNWNWNPYTVRAGCPPVTQVKFENNVIDGIESNFFDTQISDLYGFRSMTAIQNGNFEQGRCFWVTKGECSVIRDGENSHGRITAGKDGSALYQGIYLKAGRPLLLRALTSASGEGFRLFVREQKSRELIASRSFDSAEETETLLKFTVPSDGNYLVGIEQGEAQSGQAIIKDVRLGTGEGTDGYDDIVFDRGKMIYKYNS